MEMKSSVTVSKSVFVESFQSRYYLYAPLADFSAEIEDYVAPFVTSLVDGEPYAGHLPSDHALWREAIEALVHESDVEKKKWANPATGPDAPYLPTELTISITTRCNLKCVYCYIHAGEQSRILPMQTAKAAIDFVAKNALRRSRDSFSIAFHGEGEPTLEWDLFKEMIEYAKQLAREYGIRAQFNLTSNGLWGLNKREYVAANIHGVTISLDGLDGVQKAQRPTVSGASSFKSVLSSIRHLERSGIPCSVRATVMPEGLKELRPFIDHIKQQTKVTLLRLEPLFSAGRGKAIEYDFAAFENAFVDEFVSLKEYGAQLGIEISYSGCSTIGVSDAFCGATGQDPNFVVMTNGLVSSCYEINEESHELGQFFIFGKFNETTSCFEFDSERLARLRGYSFKDGTQCGGCFAQYNCRGDCLARKSIGALLNGGETDRCSLNRAVASKIYVVPRHSQIGEETFYE